MTFIAFSTPKFILYVGISLPCCILMLLESMDFVMDSFLKWLLLFKRGQSKIIVHKLLKSFCFVYLGSRLILNYLG